MVCAKILIMKLNLFKCFVHIHRNKKTSFKTFLLLICPLFLAPLSLSFFLFF